MPGTLLFLGLLITALTLATSSSGPMFSYTCSSFSLHIIYGLLDFFYILYLLLFEVHYSISCTLFIFSYVFPIISSVGMFQHILLTRHETMKSMKSCLFVFDFSNSEFHFFVSLPYFVLFCFLRVSLH